VIFQAVSVDCIFILPGIITRNYSVMFSLFSALHQCYQGNVMCFFLYLVRSRRFERQLSASSCLSARTYQSDSHRTRFWCFTLGIFTTPAILASVANGKTLCMEAWCMCWGPRKTAVCLKYTLRLKKQLSIGDRAWWIVNEYRRLRDIDCRSRRVRYLNDRL
jgi:hypothetical protein